MSELNENEIQTGVDVASDVTDDNFDADSFKVKLNQFEGPLDLLLKIIK